ncbi:uncharacterized protein TNCV_2098201 [Trichonephila clavipes]|nr:uncharacterized protein TNCV_2098201 [Trichonephila clavipes]
MDVCKCIVPSQHEGTLNSRRSASSLGRLVEGKERWEIPDLSQGVLSQNWGGNEPKRTLSCMLLKSMTNYKHTNQSFAIMNFVGLNLAHSDKVALVATTHGFSISYFDVH